MGLNATFVLAPLAVPELLDRLGATVGEPEQGRIRLLDLGTPARSGLVCRTSTAETVPLLRRLGDDLHVLEVSEGAGWAMLSRWHGGRLEMVTESADIDAVLAHPDALPQHDVVEREALAPALVLPPDLERLLPRDPTEAQQHDQEQQRQRELALLPYAFAAVIAILSLLLAGSAWSTDRDPMLAALTLLVGLAVTGGLVAWGVRRGRRLS